MEIRIQPFVNKKDRDYKFYLPFLSKIAQIMDSSFDFKNKLIAEEIEKVPCVSTTSYLRYGTLEQGFYIKNIQILNQNNFNKLISDTITFTSYGLSNDILIELISARTSNEESYVELKINSIDEKQSPLIKKEFNNYFRKKTIVEEKLSKEKVILSLSMKRKAWFIVEMRAKTILKSYPKEPFILYALGIARAAQGDLESSEDYLLESLQYDPSFKEAMFNLGMLYQKKSNHEKALKILQQAQKIESKEQPINWINSS